MRGANAVPMARPKPTTSGRKSHRFELIVADTASGSTIVGAGVVLTWRHPNHAPTESTASIRKPTDAVPPMVMVRGAATVGPGAMVPASGVYHWVGGWPREGGLHVAAGPCAGGA